MVNCQSRAGSQ